MRIFVFFSLVASILVSVLAPVQSLIWNGESFPVYLLKTQTYVRALFDFRADFAPEMSDYYFFGRMAILVHLGILFGLLELKRNGFFPNAATMAFRVVLVILSIAIFGDAIAYWGGSYFGELFRNVGFRWIEAPSIFLLLFAFGYLGFKTRPEKKAVGITFLILPFLMIGSTLFFRYIPHGPLLPISWIVTVFLLGSDSASSFRNLGQVFLRFTSVRSILLLFVAAMVCAEGMQILEKFIPVADGNMLPKKMDFRPFSGAKDFIEVFGVYGETGRRLYFWIDVIDMIFPIPLAFCFGGIYTKAARKVNLPLSLGLFAYGFLLFDLLENSLMFYFLFAWPTVPEGLAAFTGTITAVKLFFLFTGFFMFIASFLILVIQWIREKKAVKI
ncbi:hypothetical protein DLM76_07330 [Leptospira yasudae]|uniref:hypothetical protein n=1 Tax=Leptospira yasudae TaxID=2202201 RepID=UPI000E59ECE9|nr:hypothetical protein [Leptospira yasudae]RHX95124.1 hypothetical protein DLM76_07330 [Leptospira yasudae]